MKKILISLTMVSVSIIAQTTHTVGASGADFTTVTLALVAASNGDIIEIIDAIHEEAGIQINKNVTVQGLGMNNTIVQAASSEGIATDRVFSVAIGFTAIIKNMTIRYGKKIWWFSWKWT